MNRALYPIEPRLNQNYKKEEKKPIGSAMQVTTLLIRIDRFFNPKTRKVILSRDVTFIGQQVKQAKLQTIAMEKQDESDSDEEVLTNLLNQIWSATMKIQSPQTTN